MLFRSEGRFEVFTIGRDTEWEKVKEIYKLGLKHGMKLSAISGVKGVYTDADIAKVVMLAQQARLSWQGGSSPADAAAPAKRAPAARKAAVKAAPVARKAAAKAAPAARKAASKRGASEAVPAAAPVLAVKAAGKAAVKRAPAARKAARKAADAAAS